MPQVAISCVSEGLRIVLLEESYHLHSSETRRDYEKTLRELPTCPPGMLLGLEGATAPAPSGRRGKRPPSAYNLHIQTCIRDRGGDFRSCAAEWRQRKTQTGREPGGRQR